MDYYEELDLPQTASADQIHQAYRHLVRLIHPDQQPDPALRRLAEVQMKRLNMILAVLTDASRRREYDLSLRPAAAFYRLPTPSGRGALLDSIREARRTAWIWVTASLVGGITIGGFFINHTVSGPALVVNPSALQRPAAAAPDPPPVRHLHAAPAPLPKQPPKPAPPPLSAELQLAPAPADESSFQLPAQPELPPADSETAPVLPPPAAAPDPPASPEAGFAGTWLYLPSAAQPQRDSPYFPEYIELKIAEQDGRIRGSYRARYVVKDRAISPAIAFRFEGRASPPLDTLPWTGPGNSRGQVTLKLVSPDCLEVSWSATRLSGDFSFVSGMARLTRGHEP